MPLIPQNLTLWYSTVVRSIVELLSDVRRFQIQDLDSNSRQQDWNDPRTLLPIIAVNGAKCGLRCVDLAVKGHEFDEFQQATFLNTARY